MKRSQSDRIIDHLATGRPLTPLQALRKFGTFRLGARVYDLRNDGHKIKARMIERNGKRFAEYSL